MLIPLRDGRVVKLDEGDQVRIPIHPTNTAEGIWGEDAAEFKYAIVLVPRELSDRLYCPPPPDYFQPRLMEIHPRNRNGNPLYLGEPNDIHGWLSGLHRI